MRKPVPFQDLYNYALEPISYFMKRFDRSFYMGMHRHLYYEIMYAHQGGFRVEILADNSPVFLTPDSPAKPSDGPRKANIETYHVQQGEFIFIDTQAFHRLRIDSDDVIIYNIELDPKPISEYNPFNVQSVIPINYPQLIRETGLKHITEQKPGFSVLTDSAEVGVSIRSLIHKLLQNQNTADQAYAVQLGLIQLLLEVGKCANHMNEGKISYIKRALTYIRQNFHNQITLDEVAAHVGLHKVYLSAQFKKFTGRTLFATITLFRLSKCAQLLRDTNIPVADIAKRVGFTTPAQMNYEFNSHFSTSPAAYRKAFLDAEIDYNNKDHTSFAIRVSDEDFLLDDETFYKIPKVSEESPIPEPDSGKGG